MSTNQRTVHMVMTPKSKEEEADRRTKDILESILARNKASKSVTKIKILVVLKMSIVSTMTMSMIITMTLTNEHDQPP